MLFFWHSISLALIAVGSLVLICGLLRTSYANDGGAKKWANAARQAYSKITHKPVAVAAGAANMTATATLSTAAEVTHNPPEAGLTDSQKIDRLWGIIGTMESNQNGVNRANDLRAAEDRTMLKALSADLQSEISAVRSELITGLQKQALEGLTLAAFGAVAIAVGDIIGAITTLV